MWAPDKWKVNRGKIVTRRTDLKRMFGAVGN